MTIDRLSPQRALIFRITHVANLPWLLTHGLHAAAGPRDPNFIPIGNHDLIGKRSRHVVPKPPGGTLADYVPFYFTPKSPMLMNILTGRNGVQQRAPDEIVVIVSSIPKLAAQRVAFLFTDRHAFMKLAAFSDESRDLEAMIDWDILRRHDFRRDDDDPHKMDRYMAEALVHRHLPTRALLGFACWSKAGERRIASFVRDAGLELPVVVRPEYYFS